MAATLTLEGEITKDGQLVVTLPPDAPRGRVVLTLELASEEPELSEEDLEGQGLTAEEIASAPELGAWEGRSDVGDGSSYVESLRRSSVRYTW